MKCHKKYAKYEQIILMQYVKLLWKLHSVNERFSAIQKEK